MINFQYVFKYPPNICFSNTCSCTLWDLSVFVLMVHVCCSSLLEIPLNKLNAHMPFFKCAFQYVSRKYVLEDMLPNTCLCAQRACLSNMLEVRRLSAKTMCLRVFFFLKKSSKAGWPRRYPSGDPQGNKIVS